MAQNRCGICSVRFIRGIIICCIVCTAMVGCVPGVSALNTYCPGFLTVTSTPAGASVYIDGMYQGITPVNNIEINRGQHSIRLSLNGYFDTTADLSIVCETRITRNYPLQQIPITTTPTPTPTPIQAVLVPAKQVIPAQPGVREVIPAQVNKAVPAVAVNQVVPAVQGGEQKFTSGCADPNDHDCDGRPDTTDNCPTIPNTQQLDSDSYTLFSTCKGSVCKMPDAGAMAMCAELQGQAKNKCEEAQWKKANPNGCNVEMDCQKSTDGFGDACDNCQEVQNNQADSDNDCESIKSDPAYWDPDKGWLKDPQCGDTCDRCPGYDDHIDNNHDGIPDCLQTDLSIQSVDPVQTLYGVPLVKDKGTAFRVKVKSTATVPVKVRFKLTLPSDQWDIIRGNAIDPAIVPQGYTFPEMWGPVEIPANADHFVVMLPAISDSDKNAEINPATNQYAGRLIKPQQDTLAYGDVLPDVRVMPKPIKDLVSYTVIIDPDNTVPDTNKNNNVVKGGNTVVTTRGYSFGIQRVKEISKDWDPKLNNNPDDNPQNCAQTCGPGDQWQAREVMKHNLEYLLGVFPIADGKIYGRFLPGEDTWDHVNGPYNDRASYLSHLYTKVAGSYDWVVGMGCGCCGGTILWDTKAVLIGNASENINNLAHEASHVQVKAPDCYGCGPGTEVSCSGCKQDKEGFWVNRWQAYAIPTPPAGTSPADWTTGKSDWLKECIYMDFSNYAPYCWVRNAGIEKNAGGSFDDGYANLISVLTDSSDPEGLLVRGVISKNGTTTLDPFIRLDGVRLDIEPGIKGAYRFVLLDGTGAVLSQTGFDLEFAETASPPKSGFVAIDKMNIAMIIEWKDGTKRIELRNAAGKVLAARDVSSHPPVVHVISPAGGEIWKAGEPQTLRWEASDPDGDPLSFSVLVSSDGGKSWVPVGADLTGNQFTFDSTGLAGSSDARVKVRVSDGVNTAEDISLKAFTIIGENPISKESPEGQTTMSIILPVLLIVIIGAAITCVWYILKKREQKMNPK